MISPLSHQINQTVITKVWSVVTTLQFFLNVIPTAKPRYENDATTHTVPKIRLTPPKIAKLKNFSEIIGTP